jgi:hypothetical protein
MNKYIKIDEGFQEILSKINFNLSMVEVKGESVLYLFNGRSLLQQLLENPITEEEIIKKSNDKKEE